MNSEAHHTITSFAIAARAVYDIRVPPKRYYAWTNEDVFIHN
jgi:hypothetical protein